MEQQGTPELDFYRLLPKAFRALRALSDATDADVLDARLLDLVKLRVSQLNGCAWCIDMHSKDARHRGEAETRLQLLVGWRDAPCFGERERAALAFAEAVNDVTPGGVDENVWQSARAHFDETELSGLLGTVVATLAWNRINVATALPAGDYDPKLRL